MTTQLINNSTAENRLIPLFEVLVVFTAMLGFTWVAQNANLIGAESVAIWGGIIVATVFMRRRDHLIPPHP